MGNKAKESLTKQNSKLGDQQDLKFQPIQDDQPVSINPQETGNQNNEVLENEVVNWGYL